MNRRRGQRVARTFSYLVLLTALGWGSSQDAMYGSWGVLWRVDPISDENNSFIAVRASEHPVLADGSGLVVRCSASWPRGVEIFVGAESYLTSEDTVLVDNRFDDREPHVGSRWATSTDGTGAFLSPAQVESFVQEALAASNDLVWRVYDYRGSASLYRFSMDGFNDALAALGCYVP